MTQSIPGLFLEPGMFVVSPAHPEWGVGQVQSSIGRQTAVMFPDHGKVVFNTDQATLHVVDFDR